MSRHRPMLRRQTPPPSPRRKIFGFPVGRSILPLAVGADSISARGGLRRRRVCGTMQASSPTRVYHNPEVAVSRLTVGPPWFVGEGFIPPANVPAAAGSGGMRASRPTVARVVAAAPVGRASAMVRRGGPWPSRGSLHRRIFLVRLYVFHFSVGRAFTPAAPWRFQNRDLAAARGLRDDASIVPYKGLL